MPDLFDTHPPGLDVPDTDAGTAFAKKLLAAIKAGKYDVRQMHEIAKAVNGQKLAVADAPGCKVTEEAMRAYADEDERDVYAAFRSLGFTAVQEVEQVGQAHQYAAEWRALRATRSARPGMTKVAYIKTNLSYRNGRN